MLLCSPGSLFFSLSFGWLDSWQALRGVQSQGGSEVIPERKTNALGKEGGSQGVEHQGLGREPQYWRGERGCATNAIRLLPVAMALFSFRNRCLYLLFLMRIQADIVGGASHEDFNHW